MASISCGHADDGRRYSEWFDGFFFVARCRVAILVRSDSSLSARPFLSLFDGAFSASGVSGFVEFAIPHLGEVEIFVTAVAGFLFRADLRLRALVSRGLCSALLAILLLTLVLRYGGSFRGRMEHSIFSCALPALNEVDDFGYGHAVDVVLGKDEAADLFIVYARQEDVSNDCVLEVHSGAAVYVACPDSSVSP